MNIERKIITETAFENDPYNFLGVLTPEQIQQVDQRGKYFEIAKDAEVLIEGQTPDGKHEPLVIGQLNEATKAVLIGVGRNVRIPENPNNVSAVFSYDLSQLDRGVETVLRNRAFAGKSVSSVAVELFFLRHRYFGFTSKDIKLTDITGIHIVANLPRDPRQDRLVNSSEFRFRKPGAAINLRDGRAV